MSRKNSTQSKIPIKKKKSRSITPLDNPPKIIQKFDSIYHIKKGDSLILEVKVDAQPDASFQWQYNNFDVQNEQLIKIENVDKNWSRIIFEKPNEGEYQVLAKNYLGFDSASTKVIIDYNDIIINEQISENVIEQKYENIDEIEKILAEKLVEKIFVSAIKAAVNELKEYEKNFDFNDDKKHLKLTDKNCDIFVEGLLLLLLFFIFIYFFNFR